MKITKTQLRQIIKEEVQKELNSDENLQELFGMFGGNKKKARRIIKNRANYLVGEMQMDPTEAETQAAAEYKAGKLDDRGAPKAGLERSVSAGVKDNPYGDEGDLVPRDFRGRKLTGDKLTQYMRNKHAALVDMSSKTYGRKSYN